MKNQNSRIAASTEPKCYVDSGVCKVNWVPDVFRTTSLFVPAGLISSIIFLGLVYEIPFLDINPIFALAIGCVPLFNFIVKPITENFLFKDPFVASGPCPACGVENRVFFGDVLGVEGDRDESTVKCTNCKSSMTIKRSTLRVSTLPSSKPKGPLATSAISEDA